MTIVDVVAGAVKSDLLRGGGITNIENVNALGGSRSANINVSLIAVNISLNNMAFGEGIGIGGQ